MFGSILLANRYGKQLELGGVPVKVELVRAFRERWPGTSWRPRASIRPA
jgi:hypothetical protein